MSTKIAGAVVYFRQFIKVLETQNISIAAAN